MDAKLADLKARKSAAFTAGSPRSIERQHEKGKLLARERIDALLDEGSFHELDLLARHRAHAAGLEEHPYTDGVITGWGTIDGRKIFVFSQDFTVFGGALGEVFAEKIHKLMDLALKVGAPQAPIILSKSEHEAYEWTTVEKAKTLTPWDGMRIMLDRLLDLINH